jgi:hypothetical protein
MQATRSGVVGSAHLYIGVGNTATSVTVGLYGNAGGRPGQLLSTGSAGVVQQASWLTVALAPTHLRRGRRYWVAILGAGGTLRYRDDAGGSCPSVTSAAEGLVALPAPWRTRNVYEDCPLSVLITTEAPAQGIDADALRASATEAGDEVAGEPAPAPVDAAPPSISGVPRAGETLTALDGSWTGEPTSFSYQWEDCDFLGLACLAIPGATEPTYELGASDVGQTVRVIVTATNVGGSSQAVSAASATIAPTQPLPPAASAPPALRGAAVVGQTLSADEGTWSGEPNAFAYQWQICNAGGEVCVPIIGATASGYRLIAADVGHTLRVLVVATGEGGSGEASSAPSAVIVAEGSAAPINTALPSIAGLDVEGETLTTGDGSWENSPSSFQYAWELCNLLGSSCSRISGASSQSYRLTAADVAHTVRVIVTASNASGSTAAGAPVTSEVLPLPPASLTAPSIKGAPLEGQKLTALDGTWEGDPTSFAYAWEDCNGAGTACTRVTGAGGSTYELQSSDVGHTVRVVVTASNAGGSGKAISAATATVQEPVPAPPVDTALPIVSGAAIEGQTLSASNGSWENGPSAFSYQWEDCAAAGRSCTQILGATRSTHRLVAADVGHTVRVLVTASNAGGSTQAGSAATALVTAEVAPPTAPVETAAPAIAGVALEGQTLSASDGSWEGQPTSFSYQWEDCNAAGAGCSHLAGANGSSYRLGAGDVGHTVRVVVSAANAAGSAEASSAQTAVVSAAESGGAPSLTDRECFEDPGPSGEDTASIEACGYPGFDNTGVEAGVSLKSESGDVYFTSGGWENRTTGEKGNGNWEGHRLKGVIYIESGAKPVTLRNDEVFTEGLCKGELCFVNSVNFPVAGEAGVSGFVFSHDRFGGSAKSGANVVQTCINDESNGSYVAEYVKTIYCSGYKCNDGCELIHDYCPSDYEIAGEHYECVAVQGVAGKAANPVRIIDSTVFQPPPDNYGEGASFPGAGPTSAVFLQELYGELGELVLERDFLAGGAEAILDEWRASGETKLTVRQTRFARCLIATCPAVGEEELRFGKGSGTGLQKIRDNLGDGHGWFERVGLFGVLYSDLKGSHQTWQENFYDDGLQPVSLAEAQ